MSVIKNVNLSEPSDRAKPSIDNTAYEINDKWLILLLILGWFKTVSEHSDTDIRVFY